MKTGAQNTVRIKIINAMVITTRAGSGVGHSDPCGSLSAQDLLGIHPFKTGSPETGDQRGRRSAVPGSKNLINRRFLMNIVCGMCLPMTGSPGWEKGISNRFWSV